MKFHRPKFTPMCKGCYEIEDKFDFRLLFLKFKKLGIDNVCPNEWKKDVVRLEKTEEHLDGCPLRGIAYIDFYRKKIKRKKAA